MEEKLELQEPSKPAPERHRMTPWEARSHYENLTLIFGALMWWFVRDGWFNSNEKMQEHLGFNKLGAFLLTFGILYAASMLISAALTYRRRGDPSAHSPGAYQADKRRAIGVVIAAGLFFFVSWGNREINADYNRGSALVAVVLLIGYVYRWRQSAQRMLATTAPPSTE
jgi:hypothetical protein